MTPSQKLILGPVLFNWSKEKLVDFYQAVADSNSIDTVCVGEVICAKREKFSYAYWLDIIDLLLNSGKQVRFSTLSVMSNDYELKVAREICESDLLTSGKDILVEVNDVAVLNMIQDVPFTTGQLFNCYNESTVSFLERMGSQSVTLPVEMPIDALRSLANDAVMPLGVQVFGRMPLALSVRCYQARAYGLNKQNCDIICKNDLDGLPVATLEDQPLFAVNGLQTLSHSYCNLIQEIAALKHAGISEFRVSPQDSADMVSICELFRQVIDGDLPNEQAQKQLKALCPNVQFSNGYLYQKPGMELMPLSQA